MVRPFLRPDASGHSINGSNAFLERTNPSSGQGERVYLWVNEVTANFELAGTMAQSKRKRSFFAHNFVQPSLTIAGQTPNSFQYNRLAMFIRQNQLDATRLESGSVTDFLRFVIWKKGASAKRGHRGAHRPIDIEGYVKTISAGAERFVNAPDYGFEFIITRANNFLGLQDEVILRTKLMSLTQIIKSKDYGFAFEKAPKPINSDFGETDGDFTIHPSPNTPGPGGEPRPT